MRGPRSLFGRTALLIASTLAAFSIVSWQALIWTSIVPAANLAVHVLTERATAALAARRAGNALPPEVRFETGDAPPGARLPRGFAFNAYVMTIRDGLQVALNASDVRINRLAAPSEIWLRVRDVPEAWLVLSWRLAGPRAPLAALGVLAAAAIIVLGGAAISARRLTAPLAGLARAAARVAEGEKVDIATDAGPSEVRSLAVAFQSMSHRLAELDEQRELMLGGISHDLRTPLARIRVALELFDVSDPALRAEMALSIEEMDHMIGQFLQYTRSNYRESPLVAVLDEVVRESLSSFADDRRVTLKLDAASPRRFAVDCVRHILLNLVQNALEYGSPPVTVRTEASAAEISLTVQDCGAGIDASQWAEALRPFQRLGSAPSQGHSGLGLALVQRLVLSCGGGLSARQGKDGFEVRVRLPQNA